MKKMKQYCDGATTVIKADDDEPMKEIQNVEPKRKQRAVTDKMLAHYSKPSTERSVETRVQHQKGLHLLLKRLVARQNWVEASGVASMLLKGTVKDRSAATNRFKYWVTMELLSRIKGENKKIMTFMQIFALWVKRTEMAKTAPTKEKFAIQLETILYCLQRGELEYAYHATTWLMQHREFEGEPVSNMVVGLTHYQMWYSTLPQDLRLRHSNDSSVIVPIQLEDGPVVPDSYTSDSHIEAHSDTSVRHGKGIAGDVDEVVQNKRLSMTFQTYQSDDFYMETSDDSDLEQPLFNHVAKKGASIFDVTGLASWLLPIRVPPRGKEEDMERFICSYWKMLNDEYYKGAVKYLRVALHSAPPVQEALLPLVQLLLIGDNVDEALDEVDMFGHHSHTPLSLRIKATLLEHFYSPSYAAELPTCFEESLKKDPTCGHSVAKLTSMHRKGLYGTQQLLEMIALHLDATYAESSIWKEFASCFLTLSTCEEERTPTCLNATEGIISKQHDSLCFTKIRDTLTRGISGNDWKLRCKWWLNRHFSEKMVNSELVTGGDLQLVAYKAASASHMYGPDFGYVVKVCKYLKKRRVRDLLSFLRLHMKSSAGFYFNNSTTNV